MNCRHVTVRVHGSRQLPFPIVLVCLLLAFRGHLAHRAPHVIIFIAYDPASRVCQVDQVSIRIVLASCDVAQGIGDRYQPVVNIVLKGYYASVRGYGPYPVAHGVILVTGYLTEWVNGG